MQRQRAARAGGGDGTRLGSDGHGPSAVVALFGSYIQSIGHQVEVGSLPQFHIAVQARTGVPAGVGVAQIAADKNLVLALMQRIGDVEPERRVTVLPLADFGAVDENGRIHVGPAEPKHAAGAGHISDKEIFAVEQCAIAVQIVRVANLPIVGQVDGGELRVPRQQLGIRRAGGKQPVDAEIGAFHKEQLLFIRVRGCDGKCRAGPTWPCRAHTVRPVTGARYLHTINSKPGAAPCCYVRLPPAVASLSQGQSVSKQITCLRCRCRCTYQRCSACSGLRPQQRRYPNRC